ncbi:MAG: glycosyltransferase family 4 protein [Fibromonadaceae bacterium]|jgi:glycosyltransferase involved in cell wall biosynthesis|nr:glycosyltransferase family 4 protein [Fibromonadaceae bacterium]
MNKFSINGKFLTQRVTGTQRYAFEIVKSLDKISENLNINLVVPKNAKNVPNMTNIKIIRYGIFTGFLWEQISFVFYLLLNKSISVNLCGVCPALKPRAVTVLHDIRNCVHKEWMPTKIQAKSAAYWHVFQSWVICKFSKKIITVSEFSKSEIVKYYKVNTEKISIIPNAWQHISTSSSRSREKNLDSYFFAMSSIARHKNFKWVLEVAKRNLNLHFKIAGNFNPNRFEEKLDFDKFSNVEFLGYVSDEEAKDLMQNAKAFLFPSIYEGFGIPPMEALALGTPVIVSDISVLREVYGSSAHYVDPYDYDVNLDKVLAEPAASASEVLEEFSWERSARMLKELLECQ